MWESYIATPVYHISMHILPKTTIAKLEKIRRRFLWPGGGGKKRKYYLVRWGLVCRPKIKEGPGVKNLELFNICLMCKWWWRLEAESGIWQTIIDKKYLKGSGIYNIKSKSSDSKC